MWYIVIIFIALIYGLNINIIPSFGFAGSYVMYPTLWIILALLTFYISSFEGLNVFRYRRIRRWNLGKTPIHAGFMIGGFHVSMLIIIGLFAGFGKSPYSFSPLAILNNIFLVGSLLIGAEISRSYLIKKGERQKKKYFIFFLIGITLLFTLLNISFNKITGLPNQQPIELLEFFGKTFITLFSMNLLASYLSYLGGATASISYIGTLLAFEWFSPILPDPHWTLSALVGTIAPAIGYIVIQSSLLTPQELKKNRKRKNKTTGLGWPTVAIFCVLIVFFSYGYLGVKPTVIYSGSMHPALAVGDIALIENVDTDELKEGDIIQYINELNNTIIHRIVEIEISEGKKYFITKGDANELYDSPPITKQRILGKSIFTIPKLGLIQIFVRSFFKNLNIPNN